MQISVDIINVGNKLHGKNDEKCPQEKRTYIVFNNGFWNYYFGIRIKNDNHKKQHYRLPYPKDYWQHNIPGQGYVK